MNDLRGKVAVITGASSGIGAATAIECARAGMHVCLGARRKDKLERVAAEARALGVKAMVVELDVCDAAACERMVDACVRELGGVYCVYANAGYGEEIGVLDMTDAQLRQMFETNFFGSLNIIRPAVRRMKAQPLPTGAGRTDLRGHVLICSSCLAQLSIPYYGVYSATKAAQHHIGRAMKLELEREGIAVTTIHPIGTKTEFFETVEQRAAAAKAGSGGKAKLISHSPDTFMQTPQYVARLTVRALRRPRGEVWTGPMGAFVRFGMSVLTLLPGLADVCLRGMVTRRLKQVEREAAMSATPRLSSEAGSR